jgi:hypothetical protein
MTYHSPTFFGVAYTSRLFREIEASKALARLRHQTGAAPDLANREHAGALLGWLNKWGCRITKGSFAAISGKLAMWHREWKPKLPRVEIQDLQGQHLDTLAAAYAGLLAVDEFGPTAASKALFVLCPRAAIPWDAEIQRAFDLRGRGQDRYRAMLMRSAQESATLIADAARCGVSDPATIPRMVESEAVTLSELLDEYHWITITRRHEIPGSGELEQWAGWASHDTFPSRK